MNLSTSPFPRRYLLHSHLHFQLEFILFQALHNNINLVSIRIQSRKKLEYVLTGIDINAFDMHEVLLTYIVVMIDEGDKPCALGVGKNVRSARCFVSVSPRDCLTRIDRTH